MKTAKQSGYLFIISSILVFIPYTILTIIFDYPVILRNDPGIILTRFHDGGSNLIMMWWLFAMVGFPLLIAYKMLGSLLEKEFPFVKWATTIGIISGIVQIVGLLRWVFVVPVLAENYITTSDAGVQESIKIIFLVVHHYGGVVLGEHLGQLFTIVWMVAICFALFKSVEFPKWISIFGFVTAGIYLLAQTELFATVISGFPVIGWAGFVGSTLWLFWMIALGILLIRKSSHEKYERDEN